MQAQRAGPEGQTAHAYPQVWKWKQPGLVSICRTLRAIVTTESEGEYNTDLEMIKYAGLYEAGSAPCAQLKVLCLLQYCAAHG